MSAEEYGEPCPGLSERREGGGKRRPRRRPNRRRQRRPPSPPRKPRHRSLPRPRPQRRRLPRRSSRAARRFPRSAVPAAPIIQRSARGVPTGGAPALQCLEKNKAKLSAACEKAVAAATGGAAAPAAGAAPDAAGAAPAAAAPAAPVVIVLRPLRPREELFVLRSACGGDVRSICGGVAPGGGRIVQCLATNAASLSPACQDVLSQFRAQ